MNYTKPEITELGDASRTIQGGKNFPGDPGSQPVSGADCEFDD